MLNNDPDIMSYIGAIRGAVSKLREGGIKQVISMRSVVAALDMNVCKLQELLETKQVFGSVLIKSDQVIYISIDDNLGIAYLGDKLFCLQRRAYGELWEASYSLASQHNEVAPTEQLDYVTHDLSDMVSFIADQFGSPPKKIDTHA